MGVQPMVYYRVTCDGGDCNAYINVAAIDKEHLAEVLAKPNKWLKPSHLSSRAYCPLHAEGQS